MRHHPSPGDACGLAMSTPRPRPRVLLWYERLTLLRAIATILALATTIVLIAGGLERIVEPETFHSVGLSYWWAITTVTTVGYGDVVPHTTAGRVVGSCLMFTGLALIPTTTSVVVSMLVSKFGRAAQRDADERLERIEALLASRPPGGDA
jgi:voltage-gated potassium channel